MNTYSSVLKVRIRGLTLLQCKTDWNKNELSRQSKVEEERSKQRERTKDDFTSSVQMARA